MTFQFPDDDRWPIEITITVGGVIDQVLPADSLATKASVSRSQQSNSHAGAPIQATS
jgi:hypothetical protein